MRDANDIVTNLEDCVREFALNDDRTEIVSIPIFGFIYIIIIIIVRFGWSHTEHQTQVANQQQRSTR